ncbi:hypothetical protein P4O66_007444, partial [Electrophorus voltai]
QLLHNSEVSCDSSGDGAVSVRISSVKQLKQQHSSGGLGSSAMCSLIGGSKHCKYSISSSCSSGEYGIRRPAVRSLRTLRKMPQLFERSAGKFWNPKFDSNILEEACRERCFPQTQRRFRGVLLYLAVSSLLWGAYFSASTDRCDTLTFLVPTTGFLLFCFLLFLFTFTRHYAHCYDQASLLLILITFTLTLALQIQNSGFTDSQEPPALWDGGEDMGDLESRNFILDSVNHVGSQATCLSPVGTFSLGMEVLMLLYSVLHVRLYASVLLGLLYSVLFEALGWMHLIQAGNWSHPPEEKATTDWEILPWLAPAKALLHICAHVIGIHLFVMSEVRSRSTFLKVGQAIMHGKDLEVEKALKERMIHSVMPRRVANELMRQGDEDNENSVKRYSTGAALISASSPKNTKRKKTSIPRGQIIFRPFNMKRMEPVSILFADIVGFTKMSANKSAHALVGLLNDLFGRFDRLCELTCCEKISTLGDCYYCVAGCPEPRPDHAYCCVEMGLGMIQAIEQFCQNKNEMVNMRVGIHTGTVLCGILGMKRFKFDVWSNDVNLANLMEQLGVAGKVHLSEATANFLDDRYVWEDGRITERIGQSVVADQLKDRPQSVRVGNCASSTLTLSTGAAQGCVLSPLLYSLYTYNCTATSSSTIIVKFADDTVVMGLISDNNEGAYLENWCQENNLLLNVSKTKELIVDCSKKQKRHYQPVRISGTMVERVDSFRYLGVHISQDLSWSLHTISLAKKARQRLYHLRRLRDFRLPSKVLRNFYTCTIESILTRNITVLFGNSTKQDRQALQSVVRSAERITHTELPDLQTIYYKRCQTKARRIVKDPTHPNNRLFSQLSSPSESQSEESELFNDSEVEAN